MKLILLTFCIIVFIYSCKKENDIATISPVIKPHPDSLTIKKIPITNKLVVNRGISGNNTYDLLRRVDTDVLNTGANLVIIMIGSNDARRQGKIISIGEYEDNLTALVKKIKDYKMDVLLLSPPPIGIKTLTYPNPVNQRIDSMTAVMSSVALKNKCLYIDINALFKAQGSPNASQNSLLNNMANNPYHPDGLHLTAAGDEFIAEQIYKFLKSHNMVYHFINCFGDSLTYGLYLNGAGTITGDTYPAYLNNLLNTP